MTRSPNITSDPGEWAALLKWAEGAEESYNEKEWLNLERRQDLDRGDGADLLTEPNDTLSAVLDLLQGSDIGMAALNELHTRAGEEAAVRGHFACHGYASILDLDPGGGYAGVGFCL